MPESSLQRVFSVIADTPKVAKGKCLQTTELQ